MRPGSGRVAVAAAATCAVAGVCATAAFAAVGGESVKSASQIVSDATGALSHAPSVHAKGTESGVTVDAWFSGSTKAKLMVIDSGVKVHVIRVRGSVYLKAPVKYWKQSGLTKAQARRYSRYWIRASLSSATGRAFKSLVLLPRFAAAALTPDGLSSSVTTTTYQETQVAVLTDSKQRHLYVKDDDTSPLPMAIVTSTGSAVATFSNYGETVTIRAPRRVIKLS